MKEESLKRFLDLVEKTGDKVIVTDPAGEHPYVLMSLAQYERLLKLDESAPSKDSVISDSSIPESRRDIRDPGPKSPPTKPLKGPGIQHDTVLWKPQAVSKPPIRPRAPVAAPAPIESMLEAEGEEQFFLEPLE